MLHLVTEFCLVMTIEAEDGRLCNENFFVFGSMGIVTCGAPHADGRMDVLLLKQSLVVAVITEIGNRGNEKLFIIGRMRVVAGGAHARSNRRVYMLVREF
jgi:hypothetical protein